MFKFLINITFTNFQFVFASGVSSGVSCGESLISPQFTNTMTGYTASSSLVDGPTTYSPNGILMAIPWCADDISVDPNPWIDVRYLDWDL